MELPKSEMPTDPQTPRAKERSVPDLIAKLAEQHNADSDPPEVQEIDRSVGRTLRLGIIYAIRWLHYTKAGTWTGIGVATSLLELAHRMHWWGLH